MNIKQYFRSAWVACSLLATLASCGNEELITTNGTPDLEGLPAGAVQLKISGITTGAVQSRAAGDPLEGSMNENAVYDLNLFVFTSESASGNDADYKYHSYWSDYAQGPGGSDYDKLYNIENKLFKITEVGNSKLVTIVLPNEVKHAKILMLSACPRLYKMDAVLKTLSELTAVYNTAMGAHISNADHSFKGMNLKEVKELQMVPQQRWTPYDPPTKETAYTLDIPSEYWGRGKNNSHLAMIGETADIHIEGNTAQSAGNVTLTRNVIRMDVVNADKLELTKVEFVNIPTTTGVTEGTSNIEMLTGALDGDGIRIRTTHTLYAQKDAQGVEVREGICYLYPSDYTADNRLFVRVTVGKDAAAKTYTLPLKRVDGAEVSLLRNHRYVLNLTKKDDSYVDANITVADWKVGDIVDVDLTDGQSTAPFKILENPAAIDRVTLWQKKTKMTSTVGTGYPFDFLLDDRNAMGDLTRYPVLKFESDPFGAISFKAFAFGKEEFYFKLTQIEKSELYYSEEHHTGPDTKTIEHHLKAALNTPSFYLGVSNSFDPTHHMEVVKVETAELLRGAGIYTPVLMRLLETNETGNNSRVDFPSGGYENPYGVTNIPAGTGVRGTEGTLDNSTDMNFENPAAKILQNIAPDNEELGTFATYDGVTTKEYETTDGKTVYYSGSPLDKVIIRLVIDKTPDNPLLTMTGMKIVDAMLWRYVETPQGNYLEMQEARTTLFTGLYTNYSQMRDLFSCVGGRDKEILATVSRYFPAATTGDSFYLGEGGCALKFNDTGISFVADGATTGMTRKALNSQQWVWDVPTPIELAIP